MFHSHPPPELMICVIFLQTVIHALNLRQQLRRLLHRATNWAIKRGYQKYSFIGLADIIFGGKIGDTGHFDLKWFKI